MRHHSSLAAFLWLSAVLACGSTRVETEQPTQEEETDVDGPHFIPDVDDCPLFAAECYDGFAYEDDGCPDPPPILFHFEGEPPQMTPQSGSRLDYGGRPPLASTTRIEVRGAAAQAAEVVAMLVSYELLSEHIDIITTDETPNLVTVSARCALR